MNYSLLSPRPLGEGPGVRGIASVGIIWVISFHANCWDVLPGKGSNLFYFSSSWLHRRARQSCNVCDSWTNVMTR